VIHVCFYESIFQDKSIHVVFTFSNLNNLKIIHDLYSECLIKPYPKRLFFTNLEGIYKTTRITRPHQSWSDSCPKVFRIKNGFELWLFPEPGFHFMQDPNRNIVKWCAAVSLYLPFIAESEKILKGVFSFFFVNWNWFYPTIYVVLRNSDMHDLFPFPLTPFRTVHMAAINILRERKVGVQSDQIIVSLSRHLRIVRHVTTIPLSAENSKSRYYKF
jgi:hypothetical protein